ncbi:MAG: hypothetical protein J0H12_02470 [Candidatus Paracaedimonas acanthamoebae]|uniref:Uncharacterized protein n=1 Tax=Candidatus Paracaedimonas acanthamoebae TaxID=244581 RepID=A0A8J7PLQ7_9PROT|nr:hypothetical protein [Candidatus Paracaedimonas acanthamoebae]
MPPLSVLLAEESQKYESKKNKAKAKDKSLPQPKNSEKLNDKPNQDVPSIALSSTEDIEENTPNIESLSEFTSFENLIQDDNHIRSISLTLTDDSKKNTFKINSLLRYQNLEKLTFSGSGSIFTSKVPINSLIKSLNIFSQLKILEFVKLRLGQDSLLFLTSAFTSLTNLSSLKIIRTYLPEGIPRALSSVFSSCPTLEEITINTLFVDVLSDFLPTLSSLRCFKLKTSFLDDERMRGLLKILPYLPSLQKLKLEINSFTNREAIPLLQAIGTNTTLCQLSLKGRTSSEDLIDEIKNLLEVNTTLQSLKIKHEMPQEVETLLARNRNWAITLESLATPPQKSSPYASNEFLNLE